MNIIIFILVFSLIIIIHELGHFLLAKKNGITVTEFSVGMGPRVASFVRKGTRYSLKLLPFGGSCMMLGEDETIEDEGAFHKKGVWARISVIIAGPIFNFILAFVLALIVIGAIGADPANVNSVQEGFPIAESGIIEGDVITKINGSSIGIGREINAYFQFNPLADESIKITYKREGKEKKVIVTPILSTTYLLGFGYTNSIEIVKIESMIEDYPLQKAGIALGDIIVGVNGTPIKNGIELNEYMIKHPLTSTSVNITYERDGKNNTVAVTPMKNSEYVLGWDYNMYREKVSAIEVVKYSAIEVKYSIVNTVKSVGYLIRGKVKVDDLAGPVGVVNIMNDIYQETKPYGIAIVLLNLANFSIILSANLGVMNLLPIPALDGGRLVFLIIEALRGKPIDREKEGMVHMIGLVALMILMVFVLFNDIRNIF